VRPSGERLMVHAEISSKQARGLSIDSFASKSWARAPPGADILTFARVELPRVPLPWATFLPVGNGRLTNRPPAPAANNLTFLTVAGNYEKTQSLAPCARLAPRCVTTVPPRQRGSHGERRGGDFQSIVRVVFRSRPGFCRASSPGRCTPGCWRRPPGRVRTLDRVPAFAAGSVRRRAGSGCWGRPPAFSGWRFTPAARRPTPTREAGPSARWGTH